MKVPVLDQPDVASAPPGVPQVSLGQPGAGLEALGASVSQAAGQMAELYKHAKGQADAEATQSALNKFSIGLGDMELNKDTGIMNGIGEQAFVRADGYEAKQQKLRQDTLNGLRNDDQKRVFMMHSGGLLEDSNKRIQHHLAEQRRVEFNNTAEATSAVALQTIAGTRPDDFDTISRQRTLVESANRALASSPDDMALRMARFDFQAAETPLQNAIKSKDPALAEKIFNTPYYVRTNKDGQQEPVTFGQVLGARGLEIKNQIGASNLQAQAGSLATQALKGSLNSMGRPDMAKAWVPINTMAEGPLKKEATQELKQRLSETNASWEQAEKERLGRLFVGIEEKNGALDKSNPDYVNLSAESQGKAMEKAKAVQRQLHTADAEDRRIQAEQNRIAVNTFNSIASPSEQLKVNPEADFPGADRATQLAIKALQKKSAMQVQAGQTPKIEEFNSQVASVAESLGFVGPKKNLAADLKSYMVIWRNDQTEKNGGVPPTRSEINKELSEVLSHTASHWYSGGQFRFQAKPGETFVPGPATDQPYAPNRGLTVPAAVKTAKPITRTKNGKTITWDGSRWVPLGQ